jgi:single-stranded-DNA-specific exonuclease
VPELRIQLDKYARARLTPADFEPMLNIDEELPLEEITPQLFEVLRKLQPFGAGNPEPIVCASAARLTAPPKVLKDTHVRLKLAANTPTGATSNGWRRSLTHSAVGWRLAERVAQANLLPGDLLDIAFTLDQNEHPEFGGIELSLRDFKTKVGAQVAGTMP